MSKNKKPSPVKKPVKPAPARKHLPAVKPAATAKPASTGKAHSMDKPLKSDDLKRRLLERKTAKPIAFSLDEVREIAKKNEKSTTKSAAAAKPSAKADLPARGASRPPLPNHIKAASLADILGFNPHKPKKPATEESDLTEVPEKYRRYYKLLLDLRRHLQESLGQHSEETLKRSAKEDAGDLSGYGQHMADAGTDTFDRDFALSLVSNEQDALSEVEAAISRIHKGTYGICEVTGKPISRERLLAVPFTRYSAEAQKEMEKTKHRAIQRAGIFADTAGEEGGKMSEEESEE